MLIVVINGLLISLVVLVHYFALSFLSRAIPQLPLKHHVRVLVGVFGTLCAHVLEIWLFGFAYFWLNDLGTLGQLVGNFDGSLMDSVYFSFTAYTSLGIGDIEPMGDLRFLVGLEALLGLVLIAWTASFMFLEMSRDWRDN